MQRDYRLALYALGLSAVVFAAAGATVVAGVAPDGPAPDARTTDNGAERADNVTVREADQSYDVTLRKDGNGTFTFTGSERRCGGVAVESPNTTETDHQVDGTTVTLVVEDGDERIDAFGRERLAELVWGSVSDRAGLDGTDHVEIRADVYYESLDREQPLDVAGITVRPADGCLPTVRGEADLDDETVSVTRALPELDGVEVRFTDTLGVLSEDERATVEDRIAASERASYDIQRQFDDPDRLDATVLEASNDGRVDIELTAPGTDGQSVVVTVDLDDGRIVRSWAKLQLDATDIRVVDGNESVVTGDGNQTITVETTDGDAAP